MTWLGQLCQRESYDEARERGPPSIVDPKTERSSSIQCFHSTLKLSSSTTRLRGPSDEEFHLAECHPRFGGEFRVVFRFIDRSRYGRCQGGQRRSRNGDFAGGQLFQRDEHHGDWRSFLGRRKHLIDSQRSRWDHGDWREPGDWRQCCGRGLDDLSWQRWRINGWRLERWRCAQYRRLGQWRRIQRRRLGR